jgi:hypothetical protein
LHELRPGATRFSLLVNPNNPIAAEAVIKDVTAAAAAIGRQIEALTAGSYRDIDTAFTSLVQKRAEDGGCVCARWGSDSFMVVSVRSLCSLMFQSLNYLAVNGFKQVPREL